MIEFLRKNCKQYGIPYCKHWTSHVHVLKCPPDDGYLWPKHVAHFTLLNILLCFDSTIILVILQHDWMASIKLLNQLLCFVDRASRYNRVKKNQLDVQHILSIFRPPLRVGLDSNRTRKTDSYLKITISTNCCIHRFVPPDDGPRYARNM